MDLPILKTRKLKTFHTIEKLQEQLQLVRKKGKTIGFVPTMGALHDGHLRLVKEAKAAHHFVVVSIFVNPTQFNNPEDLKKYPRQEEEDSVLLSIVGCDCLFLPAVDEIYPENLPIKQISLGHLGETMEGQFRPHHFDGVVNVVARLFDIVKPSQAFFGRKDFQQIAVIKAMISQLNYTVEIIEVPIVRNEEGLALSSRNQRLTEQELHSAVILSITLKKGIEWAKEYSPLVVLDKMKAFFEKGELKLEYLQIVDPLTLEDLHQWVPGATACIAAYCGEVRLIDNMELIK